MNIEIRYRGSMLGIRTFLGFTIAPVVVPALLTMSALLSSGSSALGVLFIGAMVAYGAALLLGVPALLCFRVWGLKSWASYMLGSMVIGVLACIPVLPPKFAAFHMLQLVRELVVPGMVLGVGGAVTGWVFWLIERPDKTG